MSSLASLTTPRGKLTAKAKKKQASQLANRPASAHPSTSSSSSSSFTTTTSTTSANSVRPGAKLTPAAGATRPSKSKPEDYDIDADEGTDGYTRGGYHPVQIGDLYKNNRYTIVSKLGWGAFSTVWRAKDNHLSSSSTSSAHSTSSTTTFNSSLALPEVAIKIQKAAPQYRQSAQAEIAVLEHVGRSLGSSRHRADSEWYLSRLLDKFDLAGPHGNHVCMVFPVYGRTLLDAIRETEHRGLSYEQVKRLSHQLLTALAACHAAKVVHTDLKPENILFQRAASSSSSSFSFSTNITHEFDQPIVVADFGNARLLAECTAGDAIQTRQYRAPEVILGQVYGCAADVWSLACILFEAATGEYLFDPQAGEGFTGEEDHLALMQETLGRLPLAMSNSGDHAARYFTRKGVLKRVGPIDAKGESMEEGLLLTMQEHGLFADTKNKQNTKKNGWTMERATLFSKFLACMLRYDPQQRSTAIDLLARFAQFWPASSSSSTDAPTGSTLTEKEDDDDELDDDEFEDEFDEEESDPVNAVNEMARLVNEVETMMLSCGKEWRAVELEGLQLVADLKSIMRRAAPNASIHHA